MIPPVGWQIFISVSEQCVASIIEVKGKVLAYWPLEPEFACSNPAEAVGFFGRPENPQYAFLRRGSKIICPMSQLCGM